MRGHFSAPNIDGIRSEHSMPAGTPPTCAPLILNPEGWNLAFRMRIEDAATMLRAGYPEREIRNEHGGIVFKTVAEIFWARWWSNMTRLAQLIAKQEGFGIPAAIPTVDNNPGDLRHSPHSSHDGEAPDAIGKIATVEGGWADLERQLRLYAERGLTLREMVYEYAPGGDGSNAPGSYLSFVCSGLGLSPEDKVSKALTIPAIPS